MPLVMGTSSESYSLLNPLGCCPGHGELIDRLHLMYMTSALYDNIRFP